MIKYYTFMTEINSTERGYFKKDFVNNHQVNLKIFMMLYHKVTNNNQYKRLYTIDNKFSTPRYSTREITIRYCNADI